MRLHSRMPFICGLDRQLINSLRSASVVAVFHCEDALTCSHGGFSFFKQIKIREISAKHMYVDTYTSKCLSTSHNHPLERIATTSVHQCSQMKPGLVSERKVFWEERQQSTHFCLRNFNPQPRHLPKGWLHEAKAKVSWRQGVREIAHVISTPHAIFFTGQRPAATNIRNCVTEFEKSPPVTA